MPIRREAFDRGLDDLDERICQFLQQHEEEAYSAEEIANTLKVDLLSSPLAPLVFSLRLDRLVGKGHIESRATGSGSYYAARIVKRQQG